MKRVYIDLTDEQVRKLRPIETVLAQYRGTGVATIAQVMFYSTQTTLIIGVLSAELTAQVEALTMSVPEARRLLDLPEDDKLD